MNILVAVDGSQEAEDAIAYATDIADATSGSITLAYAVDPNVYQESRSQPIESLSGADDQLVLESVEAAENQGIEILEDAAAFAEELGRDVQTELLYGDPVAEVADHADEAELDAIVVGHRGRSERVESLLGSVAKGIVERASVPVTVVR